VNCETLYKRAVIVLCLKGATSERYRAVAATPSDSQSESGQGYSTLLTGFPHSSASLSIESLLSRSAKLLQHCIIETNGKESLQITNLDAIDENDLEKFKSSKTSSLSDQQLNINRTQSHIETSEPLPTKSVWMAMVVHYNNQNFTNEDIDDFFRVLVPLVLSVAVWDHVTMFKKDREN
jgi:hypothetical protein